MKQRSTNNRRIMRSKRFVIAADHVGVAQEVQFHLGRLLQGVSSGPSSPHPVDIQTVQSREQLSRLPYVKRGTDWLLTTESIPERVVGSSPFFPEMPNGWKAASDWVDSGGYGCIRRAIVLTNEGLWEPEKPQLRPRVVAVPQHRLNPDLCEIREIIQAGEADVDYLPPTIVHLSVEETDSGKFRLRQDKESDGPLQLLVEDCMGKHARIGQSFGDFLSGANLKHTDDFLLEGNFSRAVQRFSKELTKASVPLLRKVIDATQTAAKALQIPDVLVLAGRGPCPVHLHLHWKGRRTFQPLDLFFDGEKGFPLCAILPVVWRVRGVRKRKQACEHNCTQFNEEVFTVMHSCIEQVRVEGWACKGLRKVPAHSKRILVAVGLPQIDPHEVKELEDIRRPIVRISRESGTAVHITTHGTSEGMVIGPSARLRGDNGRVVNAHTLGLALDFGFFNACGLGKQLSAPEAILTLFGNFADEVIEKGGCAEAICNRWPVSVRHALLLAEAFYRTKPSNIHGRAAALLRARLEVFNRFAGNKRSRLDRSWLAPIHIWRRETG